MLYIYIYIYRAVDINPKAIECTQRTLLHNTVYCADCICDDMVNGCYIYETIVVI